MKHALDHEGDSAVEKPAKKATMTRDEFCCYGMVSRMIPFLFIHSTEILDQIKIRNGRRLPIEQVLRLLQDDDWLISTSQDS